MKKVEGLFLDMSELGKIHLGHVALPQMHNLRLLKCFRPQNWSEHKIISSASYSSQPSHLLHLSNKLSLLHWDGYPYKSLPSNFLMENLVELNMQGSKVEQLWNGHKVLNNHISYDLFLLCFKFINEKIIIRTKLKN